MCTTSISLPVVKVAGVGMHLLEEVVVAHLGSPFSYHFDSLPPARASSRVRIMKRRMLVTADIDTRARRCMRLGKRSRRDEHRLYGLDQTVKRVNIQSAFPCISLSSLHAGGDTCYTTPPFSTAELTSKVAFSRSLSLANPRTTHKT